MSAIRFLDGRVTLYPGDCLDVLASLPENSVDSVCCDPPYHLTSIVKRFGSDGAAEAKEGATGAFKRASAGFMGKQWDGGDIAFQPSTWAAVWRVLKPGGHLLAFSATRSYHRMAVAIEDGGFEVRDCIFWCYGSGFPKSHDISKAIDRMAGAERDVVGTNQNHRPVSGVGYDGIYAGGNTGAPHITAPATDAARQWQGFGTALKPAVEPICVARKPLSESSIAANVLKWGTGAINIDGCRISTDESTQRHSFEIKTSKGTTGGAFGNADRVVHMSETAIPSGGSPLGRWPANLIHDGSDEVLACFPETGPASGAQRNNNTSLSSSGSGVFGAAGGFVGQGHADTGGSAARFFYSAKADAEDRIGSKHPTVKPLDLIQYLCRLITPPGGTILDCFAGTGTTGEAAWREGFNAILIEREAEYQADIARRMDLAVKPMKRSAVAKTKGNLMGAEGTPLFGGEAA